MKTGRVIGGIVFLIIAAAIFYLMPAYSVSPQGTEIYFENIAAGIISAVVGIILLVKGGKKRIKT